MNVLKSINLINIEMFNAPMKGKLQYFIFLFTPNKMKVLMTYYRLNEIDQDSYIRSSTFTGVKRLEHYQSSVGQYLLMCGKVMLAIRRLRPLGVHRNILSPFFLVWRDSGVSLMSRISRLPEQPYWLYASIALQKHSPLLRKFIPLRTG